MGGSAPHRTHRPREHLKVPHSGAPAPFDAEALARQRPRLLAHLARRLGLQHLAVAEDALAQATLKALERWPAEGTPAQPAAWLYRVALNAALDHLRHAAFEQPLPEDDEGSDAPATVPPPAGRFAGELDDDELALLFTACAPALPRATQVLMGLRCLTPLPLATLAEALFSSEAALAQRLARARPLLQASRLAVPSGAALAPRRSAVLDTLALMFSEGMKASGRQGAGLAPAQARSDALALCWEAIRLARAVAAHPATAHPDAEALAARLLFHGARLSGRLDDAGHMLLLSEQPRDRWDAGMLRLGAAHLQRAQAATRLSAHHLLAGIAAEHAAAPTPGATRWPVICALYEQLCALEPGAAPHLAHAVALAEGGAAERALALLQGLCPQLPPTLQAHALAAQARAQERLGQVQAARASLRAAVAAAPHPADARLLQRRLDALPGPA